MFAKQALATNLDSIYAPASGLGGTSVTISTIVSPLIANLFIISGIVAFFVILMAGFNYISGAGDKNKMTQSTNMLTYGILGLVIVVSAFLITRIIGKAIGFTFF